MSFAGLMVRLARPMVKKALVSIGVGVVSYAGLQVAAGAAISASQTAFDGVAAVPASLLAMAGFFNAMGIIAGGITAGVSMQALKRFQLLT